MIRGHARRRGATVVEVAVVAPILLLFIYGFIVLGLGVFRYIQLASLAREGARYASVRGTEYQKETGQPAATAASVYQEAVLPKAAGFDPSRLSCNVAWDQSNAPKRVNPDKTATTNVVTVTVTYQWRPEISLFGDITLTSTSRLPMSQ